jgi:hypothetical protein
MEIEDDVKPVENVENVENLENDYNTATESKTELPEDVSKSINTVMDFVTSKIANKININTPSNDGESNVQNGFNAVNEATEKMSSTQTNTQSQPQPQLQSQNAGKKKKFRLTKKSRSQAK